MKTQATPIHLFESDEHVAIANQWLADGHVVAAPTDTVYGLMASLRFPSAIEAIYTIKERPKSKAIPILLGEMGQLDQVAQLSRLKDQEQLLERLVKKWWPGPLTLILPANPSLPDILTAGQDTVAVRIPDHDRLRQLIRIAGPLAATSANLSGHAETATASDVLAQLDGRIPAIFDGGICAGGVGSTILDLTNMESAKGSGSYPKILRAGPLADEFASWF